MCFNQPGALCALTIRILSFHSRWHIILCLQLQPPPRSILFPYTTLSDLIGAGSSSTFNRTGGTVNLIGTLNNAASTSAVHRVELQSPYDHICPILHETINTTARNTLTVNRTRFIKRNISLNGA